MEKPSNKFTGDLPLADSGPVDQGPDKLSKRDAYLSPKKLRAIVVGVLALIGSIGVARAGRGGEIDPVNPDRPDTEIIEAEGIKPGQPLEILNDTVRVDTDKINVRTSPRVPDITIEQDNKASTPFRGQTLYIENPMVVGDESNPANGQWLGFVDVDGDSYYINASQEEVVSAQTKEPIDLRNTSTVTVDKTTNAGISALDKDNNTILVATAIKEQ